MYDKQDPSAIYELLSPQLITFQSEPPDIITLESLLESQHSTTPICSSYDLSKPFSVNMAALQISFSLDPLQNATLLASFAACPEQRSRDLSLRVLENGYLHLTQEELDTCIGMLLVKRCYEIKEEQEETDAESQYCEGSSDLKMAL